MEAFRGGVGGTANAGSGRDGLGAGDQEKRRRTTPMNTAGLQGYLTSAQDALLRGFWQVCAIKLLGNTWRYIFMGRGDFRLFDWCIYFEYVTVMLGFYGIVMCISFRGVPR